MRSVAKKQIRRLSGGMPLNVDECYIVYDAYGKPPGVMLDVGSYHGDALAPFEAAGWTVHAFEPDPANFAALAERFSNSPRVTLVNGGVADKQTTLPLYTSPESPGISSLAPFTEGHRPTATVAVTSLKSYVADSGIDRIDFLKIDVEGFEKHVLDGHDWSVRPRTIVLEFEDSKTVPLGYTWTDLADRLTEDGYTVVVSEWKPIVRYGTTHSWCQFADYPAPLADDRAWGNLIATLNDRSALDRSLRRARRRHSLKQLLRR